MSDDDNVIRFPNTPISQAEVDIASSEAVLALRAANSMIQKTKDTLHAINQINDLELKLKCFAHLKIVVKETISVQLLIGSSVGVAQKVLDQMKEDLDHIDD